MGGRRITLREDARRLVLEAGPRLPPGAVAFALRQATRGLEVALCLHRVGPPRPGAPLPWLTIPEPTLDAFLELARGVPLVLTFDDGYADAVAYVHSRAPRYPDVRFRIFVCPEKLTRRAGFRWDLFERQRRLGVAVPSLGEVLRAPGRPQTENQRADLAGLADLPEFELASADACRAVAVLPNVELGNHGNTHLPLSRFSRADAEAELSASVRDFEALFGYPGDFAFPFGVPGRDFGDADVRLLERLGVRKTWSTEPRAVSHWRRPVVLPRLPVMGSWHARSLALWIAAVALGRGHLQDSMLDEVAAGAAGQ